jgi:hypothetical protein
LKRDSVAKRLFKTDKFPEWIKIVIAILVGGYLFLSLFSEGIQLLHLTILAGMVAVLFSLGVFLVFRNKYKQAMVEVEGEEEMVLPIGYSKVLNIVHRLERENDVQYFEYTLVPILRSLLLERYRSKYGMSLYNTNYEDYLDDKLLRLVKEKRPYKDYQNMDIVLSEEVSDLISRIEQV